MKEKSKKQNSRAIGGSVQHLVRRQKLKNHLFSVSVSFLPSKEVYGLYSSVEKCPETTAWLEVRVNEATRQFFDEVWQAMTRCAAKVGSSLMKSVGHVDHGWKSPNFVELQNV